MNPPITGVRSELGGPQSAELRAYRTAFHLGRPYWSGPRKARQYHLHQFDAAAALVLWLTDGEGALAYHA